MSYTVPRQRQARMRRARQRRANYWLGVIVIFVVAVVIGVFVAHTYGRHKAATVTVLSKERVCNNSNSGCKYLIFTDGSTYKISDSIIFAHRTTSSDFYGRIRPCDRYRITYYGWRFGFFSEYPNIITASDLGHVAGCRPT